MATITHKPGESFKEFRQRVINASKAAKEAKDAEYARLKEQAGAKGSEMTEHIIVLIPLLLIFVAVQLLYTHVVMRKFK